MKLYPLALAMASLTIPAVNAAESSKVYVSYEAAYDARIILSPADKDNFYYISYQGFEHSFDGTALLYEKRPNANGRDGFFYKLAGMPSINLQNNNYRTHISGTDVPFYEVYLDNDSVTRVIFQRSADVVEERRVKAKYQSRQLKVLSKVAAKKLVKSAHSNFEKSCKTSISVSIKWPEFAKQGLKATPAKTAAYLDALGKICAIDNDYAQAVQSIKTITVAASSDVDQHQATLSSGGSSLALNIGDQVPNLPETSYRMLFNIF